MEALCQAIAAKVKLAMQIYNVKDASELARKLGVTRQRISGVISGSELPTPIVADRLVQWMLRRATFERSPLLLSRTQNYHQVKHWNLITFRFPPMLVARVNAAAKALHMTVEEFTHLALDRLLNDEPMIATIDAAQEKLHEIRVVQAIKDNPNIEKLLDIDRAVLQKLGEGVPERPIEVVGQCKKRTKVEQLGEIHIEDGVAMPIEQIDSLGWGFNNTTGNFLMGKK